MESEEYWNTSHNKSFNFDDDVEEKTFLDEDNISEVSTAVTATLNSLMLESDLFTILEEALQIEYMPTKLSIEEEIKALRRKLKELQYCPVNMSINQILMGKPVNLCNYKSVFDKKELLDAALEIGDGNAVHQVVMFLKATLKPSLFNKILQSRRAAVDQLVNYLSTTMRIGEEVETFLLVNCPLEASVSQFKAEATSKNVIQKREKLKRIVEQPHCSPLIQQQVSNYISLLELQINERLHFQPYDVLDESVLETLFVCCEKFKWASPNSTQPLNPWTFVEKYNVTPAQFEWIALNSRGKSQDWRLEELFERKSVLKKNVFSIHIPIELTIIRLHYLEAPQPILNFFLKHIEDPERRLMLSKKVGAIHSIIESLVLLKDKTALSSFKDSLATGTVEYYSAENALTSLTNPKSLLNLRKGSSTS